MDSESMEPYTWRKGPRVNDEYTFDDGGDPTVHITTHLHARYVHTSFSLIFCHSAVTSLQKIHPLRTQVH